MAEARKLCVETGKAPKALVRLVGIYVEGADYGLTVVRGDGIAGDQHALAREEHRDATYGVAWGGDDLCGPLPTQRASFLETIVQLDRRGRRNRSELLKQRDLPPCELRFLTAGSPLDDLRVQSRTAYLRAGDADELARRTRVVIMPVR